MMKSEKYPRKNISNEIFYWFNLLQMYYLQLC